MADTKFSNGSIPWNKGLKKPLVRCSVENCQAPLLALKLCSPHYQRARIYGDPETPIKIRASCSIEGCESISRGRGWCYKHWCRWRAHGTPEHIPWSKPSAQKGVPKPHLVGENNAMNRPGIREKQKAMVRRGESHPSWMGGVTHPYRVIRKSPEYTAWRTAVFVRDNYTCQQCSLRAGQGKRVDLNADHIKPFALYPELRFELTNGRTLCVPCHRKTDTFGSKTSKLIKEK